MNEELHELLKDLKEHYDECKDIPFNKLMPVIEIDCRLKALDKVCDITGYPIETYLEWIEGEEVK